MQIEKLKTQDKQKNKNQKDLLSENKDKYSTRKKEQNNLKESS